MQLRRGGIRRPILILGYTPPAYARDLVAMGLRQEVHSLEYARALHEELKGSERRLKVHIKLDTGMSRLGFFAYDHPKTVEELKEVAQMPKLLIEGIFMHFPVADSIDGADANFTHTQFERFTQMLSALKGVGIEPEIRHCCNSGATILYPEYALDMVRPGIATYGVLLSEDLRGMIDLRPVMSLRSTIFQIRDFEPNITISYGRTYTTEDPARIAVIGIGYADGFPAQPLEQRVVPAAWQARAAGRPHLHGHVHGRYHARAGGKGRRCRHGLRRGWRRQHRADEPCQPPRDHPV